MTEPSAGSGRQRADAIVVLGGGVSASGAPASETVVRTARGIELWRAGAAPHIVMSGGWGALDRARPAMTEAHAMAGLAAAAGIPRAAIDLEEESRDSLGNALLVKSQLLEPRDWRSVLVVTSAWHVRRVRFLWRLVCGPGYEVSLDGVGGPPPGRSLVSARLREEALLLATRVWLAGVRPGDGPAIWRRLGGAHAAYGRTHEPALVKLAARLRRRTRTGDHGGPRGRGP